jgi:MFS family permease
MIIINKMKKSFFYGYVIILVLFIVQGVMYGPRGSFGVFIKPLTDEFDWSRALVAGAFSMSSFFQGVSGITMGSLNDKLGPRLVLTICGVLVGAGLMLMYFVDSAWQLYLFYSLLIGAGMGGLFAPQMSTAARWFVKKRNIVTGILMAGGGLGGLIGPPLITWLIYTYDWRRAFLFIGLGLFVLVICASQFLKRDPSEVGQVPYGETSETKGKAVSEVSRLSLKQALNTKKFWLFVITVFCIGFCNVTPNVHIVPYAIDRGISPETAAIILSSMNVAMPVGSVVVGFLADRIGSRRAFVTCIYLLFTLMFLLLPVTNPVLLGLFVTISAFGAGGMAVLISSLVADLFGMKSHGAILGCMVFSFTFGGASGTFIAGFVFDATRSYQWVFILCGMLILTAIIIAMSLNRIRKKEGTAVG